MKRIICALFCISVLFSQTSASELRETFNMAEVEDAAPEDAEFEFSEDISFSDGILKVLGKIKEGISDTFAKGVRCVAVICAVSFLLSIADSLLTGENNGAAKTTLSLVGAVAVTAFASEQLTSVMGMGKTFISGVNSFSKALLPSVAAAEAATGLVTSATLKACATLIFSDVLIGLINSVLIPLVYVVLFAATANATAKNPSLEKISKLASKVISITLKLLLGAFVSYISVSGLVSASADKAGLKLAQFALGTAVPVVGTVISEAAETVIAGAAMMKSAIGVFGMLTVLSAFATPFAIMLINYLAFKAASFVASPVIGANISELSSKIGECFGLILAMCASVAVLIIISVIAAMKSVGVL